MPSKYTGVLLCQMKGKTAVKKKKKKKNKEDYQTESIPPKDRLLERPAMANKNTLGSPGPSDCVG